MMYNGGRKSVAALKTGTKRGGGKMSFDEWWNIVLCYLIMFSPVLVMMFVLGGFLFALQLGQAREREQEKQKHKEEMQKIEEEAQEWRERYEEYGNYLNEIQARWDIIYSLQKIKLRLELARRGTTLEKYIGACRTKFKKDMPETPEEVREILEILRSQSTSEKGEEKC
ncbi:hypothetical protein HYW32_04525 [Candidatus Berkelbacteria bacterium]|nr:hypothetical protein [Candidatus Berkelbacteria bacterium]